MFKTVSMIKLAEKFSGRGSQKGWEFELVQREGDIAIYKKSSESMVVHEVILVGFRKAKSVNMGGTMVHFQDSETYPGDEKFGTHGWTYGHLSLAKHKFRDLVQKATAQVFSESNGYESPSAGQYPG